MKPVYQTEFGEGKGNCLAAAIASLLEMDISEVPNFALYGDSFWVKCSEWMEERNMARAKIDAGGIKPVGYHLMTVVSPRGNFHHALVGLNGEPVHDPYPGGNCQHMGVASYFILYPIDPAQPMGKVVAEKEKRMTENRPEYGLEPCPFCSSEAELTERVGGFTVDCKRADVWYCSNNNLTPCAMETNMFDTAEEALEWWNHRPIEDVLNAEVDRLNTEIEWRDKKIEEWAPNVFAIRALVNDMIAENDDLRRRNIDLVAEIASLRAELNQKNLDVFGG